MPLQPGDRAPDFTLFDSTKSPWSLAEHLPQGPVVLLFYPGAFTSTCTTELNQVNNDLARFQNTGAQVVGISTDSPYVLAEYGKVNDLQFPLLSDHGADVSAAYEAKYHHDFGKMGLDRISRRATFVVGQDGMLQHAEVLENADELPDFDAVFAALGEGGTR